MPPKRKSDDTGNASKKTKFSPRGPSSWARPPLPPVNPKTTEIYFQMVEMDYTTPGSPRKPVLRMFGITEAGNSVLVYIHDVLPYFYVPCWPEFSQRDLNMFGQALNNALAESGREKGLARHVMHVEIKKKTSLWGFQFGQQRDFMKVTLAIPSLVASSRRILEKGLTVGSHGKMIFGTYESNLPFVLRYMVDNNVTGGSWLKVSADKYRLRYGNGHQSHCQLELDVSHRDIVALDTVGKWLKVAPLRVFSFDIECAGRKGIFPVAQIDPVIQIATVVTEFGNLVPIVKNVFTLNTCASIAGADVHSFPTEKELLMAWLKFWQAVDPDVITGYNIIDFDLPYLLERAEALKLENFAMLGRVKRSRTRMKNTTFSSKAHGTRESKSISIEGRVQLDLLVTMRRDYKLRSYSLNSVSAHFLGQQKEDVHYSIITDLQNGTDETRRRLAVYCLKDAMLPIKLLEKLMVLVNYIEMSRVTGVPMNFLFTRGQQIKVVSQLYRKALQRDYVVPVNERIVSDDKYEGATVLAPKTGYYDVPIATLDFASLYPSIMMAHNLCYTTMVAPGDVKRLKPEQYVRTPTGNVFIKSTEHKGLLPEILTELLAARKNAKKLMKSSTDPFEKAVLNGRQLALKISANSVYGFTGAQVGQLPCLPISSSVTAFGRLMIDQTKDYVEQNYTVAKGAPADAIVIYGDTDSVMVNFGVSTVAEAMRLGSEAADRISQEFVNPIKLEFEKVYFPYLLMNKKRYAGLYWTNAEKWDKLDAKGIETVRRDNCQLVGQMVQMCLKRILVDKDPKGAVAFAKQTIADLLCNRVDLSLLVISKQLSKMKGDPDYIARTAHVELAAKMAKRDAGTAPVVGDRVAYVITKQAKGAPAYDKAEDPIYVLEHDIPIDTLYYLENQLSKPLTRLFQPIMGSKCQDIFAGSHTRHVKVATPSSASGGLMRWTVKKSKCIGCKVLLGPHEKGVCKHCKENQADLYIKQMDKVAAAEKLFSRVWTQCQRCQGSLHQEVLCTSADCPIFYRRKKVQKDLKEAHNTLERFANLSF